MKIYHKSVKTDINGAETIKINVCGLQVYKKQTVLTETGGNATCRILGVRMWSRHVPRPKFWLSADLKNNRIEIPNRNIDANIKIKGRGNKITFGKNVTGKINLVIYGDNNTVHIAGGRWTIVSGRIGFKDINTSGCRLHIGQNTLINGMSCILLDNNSSIDIGRDCLFSDGIDIWASDTHTIYDDAGKLQNRGHSIKIGDRVWIGKGVAILKNSRIADGSIVGMKSLVCKKFTEPRAVLCGVPAKQTKVGVNWSEQRLEHYAAAHPDK